MNNRIVPLGVALALSWIALPVVSAAQDRPADRGETAPAAGESRPAQEQPVVRPNADQDKDKDKANPERAATPPGRGNPANRDAVVGDMKDAEAPHRERLAMIAPLRALATEKGQTERLASLDKLEAKENARFERHLQKVRGRMGDDEFNKVNERLAKGRGHGKGRGADDAKPERAKPADRPKDEGSKPDRPGDDRGQGRDKDKDKDKDKPKDKDKARPEKEKADKEKDKPKERAQDAKTERGGDKGGSQPRAGASSDRGQTGGARAAGGGRSPGKAGGGKPRLERA